MKAFSVEDLRLHRKITDLHARPEFANAFGTARSVDTEANDYTSRVWMFPSGGTEPRLMTHGPGRDTSPRLSPDGKQLAFVSNRGGSMQIYVMQLDGGEARQVSEFDHGVSDFRWTPDERGGKSSKTDGPSYLCRREFMSEEYFHTQLRWSRRGRTSRWITSYIG